MDNEFIVALSTSSLSLFGGIFIITTIALFKELRTLMFRLIGYMAISILFTSFSLMIPYFINQDFCKIQGFLLSFGTISSLLWTTCIMLSLYQLIVIEAQGGKKSEIIANLIIWTLSLALAAAGIPYYDKGGGFCWIQNKKIYMVLDFYGPYFIVLFSDIFILLKIWAHLRKCHDSPDFLKIKKAVLKKFLVYPLILVICYIPVIIHRFYAKEFKETQIINILAITGDNMVGIFYFAFYVLNKTVRNNVFKCGREKISDENDDIISLLSADRDSIRELK